MSKKGIFYIVFFLLLIFGFYVALSALIPGYNKKNVAPVSYVRPFSFLDQDGRRITNKDVAGKVYVAEYFFTSCKGICPRMNSNMRRVFDRFRDEKNFMILSHSCDPEIDSVAVLKKYAESIGVPANSNWLFLTGAKDSLYRMARNSYVIDDPKDNPSDIKKDFLHTQQWALVDKNGNVVGIYDGLKQAEISDMITRISELLKE